MEYTMSKKYNKVLVDDQTDPTMPMGENGNVLVDPIDETPSEETKVSKTIPTVDSMKGLGYNTKSAMIRYLDSEGFKRGDIAKHLGIRYQHVRNVLVQPLKKVAA